jgi:protein phosphatase
MGLEAHGATHPGRRAINEDALLVDVPRGLFVVADGMGGHNAGEVASDLAIVTIGQVMAGDDGPLDDRLVRAIRIANDRILDAARRSQGYAGMGTTVSAVCVAGGRAVYVNVGDSRVYHLHQGELIQITRDDSWIANAIATGVPLTTTEIAAHPMRHVLTEVVGLRPDIELRAADRQVAQGDVLLICSDGLHGVMPPEALAATLGASRGVAEIAASLVEQAVARGGSDNVTAVVVRLA